MSDKPAARAARAAAGLAAVATSRAPPGRAGNTTVELEACELAPGELAKVRGSSNYLACLLVVSLFSFPHGQLD